MKEEEDDKSDEEIEKIVKATYRKANRLIEKIIVEPELVHNEICDKCHRQQSSLIKMSAYVELKAKEGSVLDQWWNYVCLDCLSKIADTKIEVSENIEGYV